MYILILPAFGIISEVLPTFARKPLFQGPDHDLREDPDRLLRLRRVEPSHVRRGDGPRGRRLLRRDHHDHRHPHRREDLQLAGHAGGGAIRATTALHFAVGVIGTFTIGGLSGIMHSSPPVDLQQTDTYFVVAHLHYVLIGGSLFGLLAGAYYWWPKMTDRFLDERLGRLQFWVIFIAFNVAFFPSTTWERWGCPGGSSPTRPIPAGAWRNLVSSIGAFGIGLGVLLFMINAIHSLRRGAPAPGDAWDGRTLEWRTSSPPPVHNFDSIPPVYGRDTFWREKYDPAAPLAPAPAEHGIHLPSPSHWPVVVALGLGVAAAGRWSTWRPSGSGPARLLGRLRLRARASSKSGSRAAGQAGRGGPPQARHVDVPRIRVHVLRHAHRQLPGLPRTQRDRPRASRDPQHPPDGEHVRSLDVEPAHGPGSGRRAAGRPSRPACGSAAPHSSA